MYRRVLRALPICIAAACLTGCANQNSPAIQQALVAAGPNRPQLEQVLAHYRHLGDEQKQKAAEFLIANMPGKGYDLLAFFDEKKTEVPFEALDYPDFKTASAAFDKLEKQHGGLDYGKKHHDDDVATLSADYLIDNIDAAFAAWRDLPWGREISFDNFCEYILPYRGSEEPATQWRRACRDRLADTIDKLRADGVTDPYIAGQAIRKAADPWIGFNEIYYLHPTDQSYDEMCRTKLGRCEDMTNMYLYATRSAATLCVSDYTPFWANRDNNHAWEVILHADGSGQAPLLNRAAKVYRKMFSRQSTALGALLRDGEKAPRWLSRATYLDVTDQYTPVADATIALSAAPADQRFAYVCVFNTGEWQPIHWGLIEHNAAGARATFTKLGRNVAYLPAYWVSDKIKPAGLPFLLGDDGRVRSLPAASNVTTSLSLTATTPDTPDADSKRTKSEIKLDRGKEYELFVWRADQWRSIGKQTAGGSPLKFENLPIDGLYRAVRAESDHLERIFTINAGQVAWW